MRPGITVDLLGHAGTVLIGLMSTDEALSGLPREIASSSMSAAGADRVDAVLRAAPAFHGIRVVVQQRLTARTRHRPWVF
ncbi:MAG TPA: hypothetical protein VKZ18_17020 [Polyangia bacterium]|nr:hypothetical protein [Polyangia bacterium]